MSNGKFIFLSYCHRDEVSLFIKETLQKKGYNLLCDERFAKGADWEDAAFSTMDGAEICLLAITENYEHSESCMAELKHLIENNMLDKAFPVFITSETGYRYVVKSLLGRRMWLEYDPNGDGRLKLLEELRKSEKARDCYKLRYSEDEILRLLKDKRNEVKARLEKEKGKTLPDSFVFSDDELKRIAVLMPCNKNELRCCGEIKDGKVDNSDPFLELIRELKKPENSGEKWSPQEEERLRDEYKFFGMEVRDIAVIHSRSEWAIACRLREIGLIDEEELEKYRRDVPQRLKNARSGSK